MNTYTIIVRFYNSTAIEVEADSLDSAKDIAFNKFYDEGYLGDLCNRTTLRLKSRLKMSMNLKIKCL